MSAFILANVDEYVTILEQFARPRLARMDFDPEIPQTQARGNDPVYFKFFDATAQALFSYGALEPQTLGPSNPYMTFA